MDDANALNVALAARRYLSGELPEQPDREEHLRGSFDDPHQAAWRVAALLRLYAYGFPADQMHRVLACSAIEVSVCLDELRNHLPDTESARAFLEQREAAVSDLGTIAGSADEALTLLQFWNGRWLDDDVLPQEILPRDVPSDGVGVSRDEEVDFTR